MYTPRGPPRQQKLSEIDAEIHRCTTRLGALRGEGGEKPRNEEHISKLNHDIAGLKFQLAVKTAQAKKLQDEINEQIKNLPTARI